MASNADGANVAVVPAMVTVPATGLPAPSATVNVAVEMDAPAIVSLNVAFTAVFAGTPAWLAAGFVEVTVGGVVSAAAPVVKVQTLPAARALFARSVTPVVMVAVGDPLHIGLISSLNRPGGNITGLTLLTPDLSGKRLQLVLDVLGRASRVALLINPGNRSHEVFLAETQAAAGTLGIRLQVKQARNAGEIDGAFDFAGEPRPDAIIVFDDPVLWGFRKDIVAHISRARLPAVYGYAEFVEAGGLMSLGPDRIDHYRRTARYVDRILKGDHPAEMPVERPTKFELVINAKTARAQGLTLSQTLLLRADRVIE